jgi:hypothetical protein
MRTQMSCVVILPAIVMAANAVLTCPSEREPFCCTSYVLENEASNALVGTVSRHNVTAVSHCTSVFHIIFWITLFCNESGIAAKPFQPLGSEISFPPYIFAVPLHSLSC